MQTIILLAIGSVATIEAFYKLTKVMLNVLVSYPFLNGQTSRLVKVSRHMMLALYLDSGAFSANQGRVKITISEYSRFINMFGHYFTEAFTLDDKFDDPDHNAAQQWYLEENLEDGVKKPIPALHEKVNVFDEIRMYHDAGHRYLAVGSDRSDVNAIFEFIAKEFPDVALHLFGNLNRELLYRWHPRSADSAGWVHQAKTGIVNYLEPNEKKEYLISFAKRLSPGDKGTVIQYKQFIEEHKEFEDFLHNTFGYSIDKLAGPDPTPKQMVNLYFYKQLEDHLNTMQR